MGENNYDLIKDLGGLPTCILSDYIDFVDTHFHYAMELIYMVGNRMTIFIGTERIVLSSGEYICINSGVAHATENIDGDCYYLCAIPKYTLMPSIQMFTGDFVVGRTMKRHCSKPFRVFHAQVTGQKIMFFDSITISIMSLILAEKVLAAGCSSSALTRFLEMISYICD